MPNDTALKFVLQGQVVTMDDAFHVLPKGAVYVDDVTIAAVQAADAPPPAGFANAPVVATKGTIYPGMIELHNHLSYDALTLWNVPKKYDNRDQWPNHPEYHQLVTGPMSVLGTSKRRDLLAALVRYVESKCLFGGVTTSQGITLSSNAGVQSYYKGVVRNVEHTGDKALPAARTHVADVAAKDWQKFLTAISGDHVMILHLAEGKDTKAREHFLALKNGSKWAITNNLVGIHCAGLTAADFAVMASHGGSMVWSPLSNYLLYGDTADIVAAKNAGVPIALGSDWSPSGSKNLLGELKVARLVADQLNAGFSDRDLVAMVTRTPAKMVKWDALLGSIEVGKRADLLILDQANADPYKQLIGADESHVALVVIDGVARYGTTTPMAALGAKVTPIKVAGKPRSVQYHDPSANSDIDSLSLEDAEATLKAFFGGLPNPPKPAAAHPMMAARPTKRRTPRHLLLPELDLKKPQRPLLTFEGHPTGWTPAAKVSMAAAKALPLKPIDLDPLTLKDDDKFVPICQGETNLPDWLKSGLKKALT